MRAYPVRGAPGDRAPGRVTGTGRPGPADARASRRPAGASSIALSTAVLSGGFVALASPASAACDDTGTKFSIVNKKTVWKNTNLHSDWGKPGVTLRYDKTKPDLLRSGYGFKNSDCIGILTGPDFCSFHPAGIQPAG
ncbi:hypothetical protein [Streptomyces cyaneofuscatus]|uniref:hypothetical protein n=1 Tax=Streptomyces cyaneofuscatus TaxID=66883 RepID=UPI0033B490E5